MAGMFNGAVTTDGTLAFQDRANPELFHYLPLNVPPVLGDTLESFSCRYYGIGPIPQWVQIGQRYESVVGGVVRGAARFDASARQKRALRREIRRRFEVRRPQLLPVRLHDLEISPVVAGSLPTAPARFEMPDTVRIGESFHFLADAGNSLFPQLVAHVQRNPRSRIPTALGVNLQGTLDLDIEPLRVQVQGDLAELWRSLRRRAPAAERLGWHALEEEPGALLNQLSDAGILSIRVEEEGEQTQDGHGALVLRSVVDALNARVTRGEPLCRFTGHRHCGSRGSSDSPWIVEVNLATPANAFSRGIFYDHTLGFEQTVTVPVTSFMELSVACSPKTHRMFFDATADRFECITRAKVNALQERIRREMVAKEAKIKMYEERLLAGDIDLATFEALVALLNTRTLTETPPGDRIDEGALLADVEASARRRATSREVNSLR